MEIRLPGVDDDGNHRTSGPEVAFTFEHRGQAGVTIRVAHDATSPPIRHPKPAGGQHKPRKLKNGTYLVTVQVDAIDLPGLPAKTIDSDLSINGVLVLEARGRIPDGAKVDRDGAMFRLIVQ